AGFPDGPCASQGTGAGGPVDVAGVDGYTCHELGLAGDDGVGARAVEAGFPDRARAGAIESRPVEMTAVDGQPVGELAGDDGPAAGAVQVGFKDRGEAAPVHVGAADRHVAHVLLVDGKVVRAGAVEVGLGDRPVAGGRVVSEVGPVEVWGRRRDRHPGRVVLAGGEGLPATAVEV